MAIAVFCFCFFYAFPPFSGLTGWTYLRKGSMGKQNRKHTRGRTTEKRGSRRRVIFMHAFVCVSPSVWSELQHECVHECTRSSVSCLSALCPPPFFHMLLMQAKHSPAPSQTCSSPRPPTLFFISSGRRSRTGGHRVVSSQGKNLKLEIYSFQKASSYRVHQSFPHPKVEVDKEENRT